MLRSVVLFDRNRRTPEYKAAEEAERAIREPDRTTPGRGKREVRMRKFDDPVLRQPMLLCVIVEDLPSEYVVVTLYKTSRLDKYLK